MESIKLRITFQEKILGTSPANEDVYRDFIASKAPDAKGIEDEIEALGVEGAAEKGMTIFPKDADGNPILWDYQIKGFFKDACSMLARVGKTGKPNESSKLKAYKKIIDGLIFPQPRQIVLHSPGGMGVCQRPLRAQTPQGERVALAMSEELPAGTWCDVEIVCLTEDVIPAIFEWLDYGAFRGIGQWRNSGCGRFTYVTTD